MLKRSIIISALAFLLALPSVAQRKKTSQFLQGFFVGGKVGPNLYFGDLVDDGKTKIGIDVFAQKEVLPYLMVRGGIGGGILGGIQGSKKNGLTFTTPYFNFNVGADWTFLNLFQYYTAQRLVEPYIGVGCGLLMYSATKKTIQELSEEIKAVDDWRNVATGFTVSPFVYGLAGGRYNINRHWGVSVEVQGNFALTDELDGHTGWRGTYSQEEIDQMKKEYIDAGLDPNKVPTTVWNDGKNDFFYTIMAGCTYKFADFEWKHKARYNRNAYIRNRKVYKRNASRVRRR